MIPRNFLLFKGIIHKSFSKSWKLTSVGNKVIHENNVLRFIKNEYIISNQKNFAFMKGGLRCTTVLLNNVSTNSIMERIDDKMMPMISKKQEDVNEDDCNKRKGIDTLTESEFQKNTKSATLRLLPDVTSSKKILRHPDFEIVGHFKKKTGNQTRSLIVFVPKENPNEETRCVVYHYTSKKQKFVCNGCKKCGRYVSAQEMNDENGEKIVEFTKNDHICEPDLYENVMQRLKPDLIEKPNYEIKDNGKNLIVYTDIENKTGYQFNRCNNRKHITTFYCKTCKYDYDNPKIVSANEVEKDGRTVLQMNKHVCKPIKFRLDLSEIEQSDLIWPKANEGNKEYEELMTKMRLIHPVGICPLEAVTYVIHNAPHGSSVEIIASCILYVGYRKDYKTRFANHLNTDCVVAELNKKYGEVFLTPIFYDIPSACCDLEALIYVLNRHGSLNLPLQNLIKCSWKSSKEKGGFRNIAENPDHPDHNDLVLGIKKLIITAIANAPMISSRTFKRC